MTKYLFKDTFAVIGKMGLGNAENPHEWIPQLWDAANANFQEIESLVHKNENDMPLIWGAMNDVNESNKRWGEIGKYMASGEVDLDSVVPKGCTKWIIPAQTYLVVSCTMDKYGEVFKEITSRLGAGIIGTVHEFYPEPGNPNVVDIYFPIAEGDKCLS